MVPAADAKKSQDAMDQTFLLSNIAPQVGNGFNRHCTFVHHIHIRLFPIGESEME